MGTCKLCSAAVGDAEAIMVYPSRYDCPAARLCMGCADAVMAERKRWIKAAGSRRRHAPKPAEPTQPQLPPPAGESTVDTGCP